MSHPFQAGGALLADSPVYVERKSDHEALVHLRNMAYLLVIEPRQQGKTSLVNHLMCHPALGDVAFAHVDVTTPDRSTEATWYQTLCPRILRQLRGFIPRDQCTIPHNSVGWRDFLYDVALLATDAHQRVAIALDEIGAMKFPGATEFFSVLRDVYNSRQAETEFKQLTFLLAGAFHPRDLIEDDKVSPFNIAERVRLPDFRDPQEIWDLVRHLLRPHRRYFSEDEFLERVKAISERIHHWADGQPYLTQWICNYLTRYGPAVSPEHVDRGVDQLRRDDENHLPPILEQLKTDKRLCNYVKRVTDGERIKFYPRENSLQARLELMGIVKADVEGCCIIRNRICARALAQIEIPPDSSTSHTTATIHTLPNLTEALQRRTLALFIGADLPREVTGLPSRADLARELARRKGLDESLSLAEVAQRVSQAGNRWEFTDFIRNALDTAGKSPQPFHKRIVELVKAHQIETLITTAYDNLLELAFQEAGIGINCVVRGSDVAFIRPDRPTLTKLYGDAQQPDALVVTDRDHSDLLRDQEKEPLVDEVRRAFRRNTVFFLGYNLTDPDFRFLFDQIAESRFARTAYAVWPGLPEADVRMWHDRGIAILGVDPLGILGEVGMPPVPPHRPEPTVIPPVSQSSIGGKDMDFERGLDAFKRLAEGTDWYQDFTVHEAPLRENLRDERRYGPSEQTRRDRTRIVDQLNALALEHLGISFNDLCMGKQPTRETEPTLDDHEIIERLRRIEDKIDQGRAEDRQAAAQIMDAIAQNQVEQAEAAQMVGELRAWAQTVQQAGLPLNPELRAALDALAEHTGGVYQYLELALPIIPGILSYKVELGSQHQVDLRAIWERIKTCLGKKEKAAVRDRDFAQVTILLEGDFEKFTTAERDSFIFALSRVVDVPADQIRMLHVAPGSVLVTLEMPEQAAQLLVSLYLASDPALETLHIRKVELQKNKGKGEPSVPEPIYGIGNQWAVLVGVNEYEDKANYGQLHVCVKDVHAIREQLTAGGFDPARIRLLADKTGELPTKANILVALKAVADATEPDDLLLFYYSGHGDEEGGESYLVARDGRRLVLGDTAVPLSRVREIVEGAPARAKIIVLDACHSGADIGGKGPKPMSEAFIRRVFEQAEGMAMLASCKQGQLSYEWRENERSVFTHFLLEALEGRADRDEKGFVTVQDANRHVANGVKLWASQRNLSQTPTLQYTVAGDIILVRHQ